ncbi:MAG TPA: hypothetical protein PK514_02060 [Spirochaetota bacterium]|nr:hypothetical protein [Spirochaetota bacterium]
MKNDQRRGPDFILNLISGISTILWIIFAVVFILLAVANPTHSGTALSRPGLRSGGQWIYSIIYILLIVQTLLSISGIVFNLTRMKRKTDHVRITLILLTFLGIAGIIMMKYN